MTEPTVLDRVREAIHGRARLEHPGAPPPRAEDESDRPVVARFAAALQAAGGEVVRFESGEGAREWLRGFEREFESVARSASVPVGLQVDLPAGPPEEASLGVSVALGAAADTGSLVLASAEGRRLQLLPPTLLVWVRADSVRSTLQEALAEARATAGSAIALHSGPSKSADIGRVLVTGVHGPGRLVAVVIG